MESEEDKFKRRRGEMVEQQIARRGVEDDNVLGAMRTVPREAFVPPRYRSMAYSDRPLPIGQGQTISQPYIVAMMTESAHVAPGDRVLEIGTGSGYGAAILSRIADEVYTIERHAELADEAEQVYRDLGYDNIEVVIGDGTKGLPDGAPFDAIICTASGPQVPESYKSQIDVGGTIVMPVGKKSGGQQMVVLTRTDEESFEEEDLGFVRFVPLIGNEAWEADESTGASRPSSGNSSIDL
jgi:protein-L-isoaspartate(D-aspartate) O-methyltransferase